MMTTLSDRTLTLNLIGNGCRTLVDYVENLLFTRMRRDFYFGRSRALLFVLALLVAAVSAHAQTKIRSLTDVINGHAVGGVTTDLVGNIYVADFGDTVWKITPEGERSVFASGLYGASGNAIDHEGNLLQSNFYGDSITKIDRKGQMQPFVTSGLSGPVGIASTGKRAMSMLQIAAAIRSQRLRRMAPCRHSQKVIFSAAQTASPSIAMEIFMSSTSETTRC